MSGTIIKEISSCRVCGNKKLFPVLSLGHHFVSDFVLPNEKPSIRVPLELVLCTEKKCSLLQLKHTTPSSMLYRNYWYKSGVNKSMRDALSDIARKAEAIANVKAGGIALDIGCNDGTLLRAYSANGIKLVGFDPAKNLFQFSSVGTTKIFCDFFNALAFEKEFAKEKAKIITTIAMFYDLDDPNTFVQDIAKCLHPDGVWVIQMSYLPLMLEQNAFDNICHEHLEYYSLHSLAYLLQLHSLEIVDVELNDVNGGSFRVYAKHKGKGAPFGAALKRIKALEQKERGLMLDSKTPYEEFAKRVEQLKQKAVHFIKGEAKKGKNIFVYGASTKGNTLLQYYGLDNTLIKFAAERNEDKYGKMTVGTMIPIISEENARSKKPDYFFVLPWHFLTEFVLRETEFLNAGGKLIFPLPKFNVISKDSINGISTEKK